MIQQQQQQPTPMHQHQAQQAPAFPHQQQQARAGLQQVGQQQPPLQAGPAGLQQTPASAGAGRPRETQPSKVLHLKPVPKTATQHDIIQLFMPYAPVETVKIFHLAHLGQAFVELPDVKVAQAAYQQMRAHGPTIQGVPLTVEFSNRQEITPHGGAEQAPHRVLLITVNNLVYQIDLDLIHSLFCKFGNILRMAIFNRPNKKDTKEPPTVQCLVEYSRVEEAIQALQTLNGRCIYAGCNELEIQFSKLQELTVRQNNERTRDLTNPNLPTGDEPSGGPKSPTQRMTNGVAGGGSSSSAAAATSPVLGAASAGGQTVVISNPFGTLDVVQLAGLPAQQVMALHENLQRQVMLAQSQGKKIISSSAGLAGEGVHLPGHGPAQFPQEVIDAGMDTANKEDTPVLMVHQLPGETITPQKVFNLFSIYGPVQKVKILHNRPDVAMVQFAEPAYATLAFFYTNGLRVGNNEIQVVFSKNKVVRSMQPGDEGQGFKNMSFASSDQRYGEGPDAFTRFARNACKPTDVVFVANLPEQFDEIQLDGLFRQIVNVRKVTMLPSKEGARMKMAQVAVDGSVEAVEAVMVLHGQRVGDRELKVAFTKTRFGH